MLSGLVKISIYFGVASSIALLKMFRKFDGFLRPICAAALKDGCASRWNMYRLMALSVALLLFVSIYAEVSEAGENSAPSATIVAKHAAANDYHLASGDMIRIRVFGEDELDLEVRLDSRGVINYPFLGKIHVTGLTVEALQNKLVRGLQDGYLNSPHVNVSIVEHRSFFITGEVNQPGAYPYQAGLTVRKAVSLAGGFAQYAMQDHVSLLHDNDSGVNAVMMGLDAPVAPGDSISVSKSVFYIDGEVNKPGSYPLHSGLTLREAISLAGGTTERASDSGIKIISEDGIEHNLGNLGMGTKIVSGDSIYIKQSFF